jgi:hypothetical protein
MTRHILRFRGKGDVPAAAAVRIRAAPGVSIVDQSARMLLVEGDDAQVSTLASMIDWIIAKDTPVQKPTTKHRIGDPPPPRTIGSMTIARRTTSRIDAETKTAMERHAQEWA